MNFYIEEREGIMVLIDATGGVRPATKYEVELWQRVKELQEGVECLAHRVSEDVRSQRVQLTPGANADANANEHKPTASHNSPPMKAKIRAFHA